MRDSWHIVFMWKEGYNNAMRKMFLHKKTIIKQSKGEAFIACAKSLSN